MTRPVHTIVDRALEPLRSGVFAGDPVARPNSSRSTGSLSGESLVALLEAAALTGKGGAGFPTARKVRLMMAQAGPHKTLVVNGSEHEPGSLKDRFLLEVHAHQVVEGAMILARAVGADTVVFAINAGSAKAIASMELAVATVDRNALGVAPIALQVRTVPEVYIVGEETALLETLEGREPLPRRKPPFPIEQGLNGLPTLVQNVETVARIPFIVSSGAEAHRALGTGGAGSTLCTFGPEFVHAGVRDVPLGISIRELLDVWGGGRRDGLPIKCIQPGGPSTGFVMPDAFDQPFDAATLSRLGSALGCAVIRAFSVDDCMVRHIGETMHFFAVESCGQCPRCRMETNMLDTIVRQVLNGAGSQKLLDKVEGIIQLARGQGICSLIDMPVAPIRTGLHHFADEFVAHIEHRCTLCEAGAAAHHAPHEVVATTAL